MDEQSELHLRTRRLSHIEPEPIHWIWKGRLAEGMISLYDGNPGLGKSTVMLDIAARITTGRRCPDDDTRRPPGRILILAGEDSPEQVIRPRIENAGGDPDMIEYLDVSTSDTGPSFPASFPRDLHELTGLMLAIRPKLLIMDPVSMFFGNDVDTNNDSSVRVVLSELKGVAEKYGCAVMMARHRTKSREADPLTTGQGSMGFIGAARFGFLVARDPTDEERECIVIAPTKQNASSPAKSLVYRIESVEGSEAARVKWLAATDMTAESIMAVPQSVADLNKINDAREWVRDAMQGGEQPIKELLKKAGHDGFDTREIKEAIDLEGIRRTKGSIDGATYNDADKSWYYRYPGTPHGGTPPDEDADMTTDIDPDEYTPGRTAPAPIAPDEYWGEE